MVTDTPLVVVLIENFESCRLIAKFTCPRCVPWVPVLFDMSRSTLLEGPQQSVTVYLAIRLWIQAKFTSEICVSIDEFL